MKAIIAEQYGPPDVLQLKEIEKPTPKDGELLIRVHTATVNRTDCAILSAKPIVMRLVMGVVRPRQPVMGTEFAGEVVATGSGTERFRVGDRVFGFHDMGTGSLSQYITIQDKAPLATIPEGLSYEQVAGSIEGAHYAQNFINKLTLKPGQEVIVNGASGAIGSAALQLLKHMGLRVSAVCSTAQMDLIASLGAEQVFDYTREDFTKCGKQFDYVFDCVGKSSFFRCFRLLKARGVYISSELGFLGQNLLLSLLSPLTRPMLRGRRIVFPFPKDIQASIDLVRRLLESGAYMPVVDKTYPLEETAEAFRFAGTGQKVGNIVNLVHQG